MAKPKMELKSGTVTPGVASALFVLTSITFLILGREKIGERLQRRAGSAFIRGVIFPRITVSGQTEGKVQLEEKESSVVTRIRESAGESLQLCVSGGDVGK